VRYAKGPGGILLNQLNIVEREVNPVNAEKKGTILKALLKNLGATFGGTGSRGGDYATAPIALPAGVFNAYTTSRGKPAWFQAGDKDLSALPAGDQPLAGTTYHLNDFKTSPVPGAVMLKGPGSQADAETVTGIAIGRTADALCFLHAFNAGDKAKKAKPGEAAFRYVVHYADGQTTDIVVGWQRGVAHWIQDKPADLPDAALAWAAPFPADKGHQAALYSLVWKNPRPQAAIASIDLAYVAGGPSLGVPALLAVSVGTAK
jgi:hypothetical protein